MRYYVPLCIPPESRETSKPSTAPGDKFGGVPSRFPAKLWPYCRSCGRPLQFLAQFHHQLALDLGAPGRILFLFMCENEDGECETFGQTAGANAAIIVDAHEQTDSPQKFPAATSNPEFLVRAYREADDGVPPEQANEFYAH